MAFDEWMFAGAIKEPAAVFLRLYSWQPGAITVGYNQDLKRAVDHSRLAGTAVIRRITGGRALYHDPSELTYSVAIGEHRLESIASSGSVSAVSRVIAEVLVEFLATMGLAAEPTWRSSQRERRRNFFHKAPCFASFSRYEIASQGRKVVASAQRQIGRTVFQHGSIKMAGVATHPALPRLPGNAGQPVVFKPLSKNAFLRFEKNYRLAFESLLESPMVEGVMDQKRLNEVEQRCLYVEKYFDRRRDIF